MYYRKIEIVAIKCERLPPNKTTLRETFCFLIPVNETETEVKEGIINSLFDQGFEHVLSHGYGVVSRSEDIQDALKDGYIIC